MGSNPTLSAKTWMVGREAECTSFENWRPRKGSVGSNPTPSAKLMLRIVVSTQDNVAHSGRSCAYALVAQQVERSPEKARVGGSIPSRSTNNRSYTYVSTTIKRSYTYAAGVGKWQSRLVQTQEFCGFESHHRYQHCGGLVQLVEHLALNQEVEGSRPSLTANGV